MTTGAKDIIWCLPKWVPDKEIQIEYFIKKNKKSLSLQSIDEDSEFDMIKVNKIPKKYELKIYKKIQINSKHNYFKKIKNLVKKNGNRYILDIDLDYFVCNGEKFKESYFKEPFDLESNHRTKTIYINQNSPRNKNYNSLELDTYTNELNIEIKKINKRINQFITLLRDLKNINIIPCLITMSDSSNVMFGDCINCNTISNGYVPSHLALYVHYIVVKKLKNLFNSLV